MNQRPPPAGLLTGVAFAISFLYALYLGAFGVILPAVGNAFGLGAAIRGRLFLTSFLGSALGVLLCGFLSDRWGRRPLMLASLGAVTLGMALFGSATTFSAVLVAAPLIGGGCAAAQTVATALLSDLYASRRAFYLNAMQTMFSVGAVLASPLMQGLLAVGGSWRTLYLVMGTLAAAIFLLLAFSRKGSVSDAGASGAENLAMNIALISALLRRPAVILFCASAALYAGAEVAFFSWMPTFFQKELPGGSEYAGYVVSVFWIAMSVGRALTGSVVHWFPLRRLRFSLACGGALSATLTLLSFSPGMALLGVVLTGLCFSGIFGLLLAEGSGKFPNAAGTIIGLIAASSSFGVALIPFAVGTVAGADVSWRVALSLAPLAALLMAGLTSVKAQR